MVVSGTSLLPVNTIGKPTKTQYSIYRQKGVLGTLFEHTAVLTPYCLNKN